MADMLHQLMREASHDEFWSGFAAGMVYAGVLFIVGWFAIKERRRG